MKNSVKCAENLALRDRVIFTIFKDFGYTILSKSSSQLWLNRTSIYFGSSGFLKFVGHPAVELFFGYVA